MNAGIKKFIYLFFFFLPLSYNVQPFLAVHCSKEAKIFGYNSTNRALFLHLVVLKITI